ncbi:hypothetical protein Tdes44962_MAKER01197 [Teratosphaeria destructans]|uniref:Uncharacterized protein n=1 Tax=Teratosphaeria destructans TaxID=418781 RepID=A0A9W7W827_9PEZI|nr:hypothetical protein Tdes44962_MAKER01197 [Teratosphaeria destructans]
MPLLTFTLYLSIGTTTPPSHNTPVPPKQSSKTLPHPHDRGDPTPRFHDRACVPAPPTHSLIEEARRRDRESLGVLLHYFPSLPPRAKVEQGSDARVVGGSSPARRRGLLEGAPGTDGGGSRGSEDRRVPFRGRGSGGLLRSSLPEDGVGSGRMRDEGLRRRDWGVGARMPLGMEDGGCEGRAGAEGFSIDGEDGEGVVLSTLGMRAEDDSSGHWTEIADGGGVVHQSAVLATRGCELDAEGTVSSRVSPASTPEADQARAETADDSPAASAPSTRRPHYALPTAAFRRRDRQSHSSGDAPASSAPTVAKRTGTLPPNAKFQSKSLQMHSRPSSGLSSAIGAQTRNLNRYASGAGTKISAPVSRGGPRITSAPPLHTTPTDSRVAEMPAGRSSSWNPHASNMHPSSRFPGLSASLTPVVIRGGDQGVLKPWVEALPGRGERAVSSASVSEGTAGTASSSDAVEIPGMRAEGSEDECSRRFDVLPQREPADARHDRDPRSRLTPAGHANDDRRPQAADDPSRLATSPSIPEQASPIPDVLMTDANAVQTGAAGEGEEEWEVVSGGERGGEEDVADPFEVMSPAPRVLWAGGRR